MSEYSAPKQFIDLAAQQKLIRENIDVAISKVLNHGQYIMGPEVKDLETRLCEFTGAKHALSCANGTDALTIALMTWDIGNGDAVFVPSFTYVASAESPAQIGATPFFVDVLEDTFNMDPESFKQAILDSKKLDLKPAVVILVDLFGQPGDIDTISEIAKNEGIKVLIDAAQSFGGESKGRRVGSMGDITTTSFFPAKPLGCYGDGGAIFTNDEQTASKINSIRLHGKGNQKYDNVIIGINSRLDTIQAAILLEKLKIFPHELDSRNLIACKYSEQLSDSNFVKTPVSLIDHKSAWAQYTLKTNDRTALISHLNKNEIPSVIYYPKSLHQQDGYKHYPAVSSGLEVSNKLSSCVLSLPMHPYLKEQEISYICKTILSI